MNDRVLVNQKIRRWLPVVMVALGVAVRVLLLRLPGYPGDSDVFLIWSRRMVVEGFSTIYSLRYPLVNYSPVALGVLALIGQWYLSVISPAFSVSQLASFTIAVKIVFGLFELGAAIVAYVFIRRRVDEEHAIFALSMLILNPALFLNSGYWGLLDSLHTLLIISGFIGLTRQRWGRAWLCITLAALSKPPTLALLPLAGLYTVWQGGWRQAGRCALLAGLVGMCVFFPFILAGQWVAFIAPIRSFEMFPVWSSNAHNLWWLLSGGRGWDLSANLLVGGMLKVSTIGVLLFAAVYLYALTHLRRNLKPETLWSAAAFVALGSFLTLTGLHENHLYMVIAVLVVAASLDLRLIPLLFILSLTATFNMLAHDPLLLYHLKPLNSAIEDTIRPLTWLNALVNLLAMLWWALRAGTKIDLKPLHER